MAIGDIKTFDIVYSGLTLRIDALDLGGGKTTFEITCISGSADINALYWNDGDATANEGALMGFNAKSDSSLNMNGTGQAWDGGVKLSSAGIGPQGLAKPTYLQTGETYDALGISVDWNTIATLGVRATSTSTAEGSIKGVDNTPVVTEAPCFAIDDVTVTEGTDANATFTVTLEHAYLYDIKIAYTTTPNTAGGSDYTTTAGTLTILAGQTAGTISVPILDDNVPEDTETFFVNITGMTADVPGPIDLVLPTSGPGHEDCDPLGIGTILDTDRDSGPPPPDDDNFPNYPGGMSHATLYFRAGDLDDPSVDTRGTITSPPQPTNTADGWFAVKFQTADLGTGPFDLDDHLDTFLDLLVDAGKITEAEKTELVGVSLHDGQNNSVPGNIAGNLWFDLDGDTTPDTAPADIPGYPILANELDGSYAWNGSSWVGSFA